MPNAMEISFNLLLSYALPIVLSNALPITLADDHPNTVLNALLIDVHADLPLKLDMQI